jgi:ribonuclease HII
MQISHTLFSQFTNNLVEAGVDEAGRGCLAGPVVAAAVILPKNYEHKLLRDSKKLNEKQRELLKVEILRDALAYAIAEVDNLEIDAINIRNASCLAMQKAVGKLAIKPELLLIDGNFFKSYQNIDFECVVKGDDKFLSIAAASILAKTHRDFLMQSYSQIYKGYGWETNAGYPTKFHYQAIQNLGITPLHRKTFRLI